MNTLHPTFTRNFDTNPNKNFIAEKRKLKSTEIKHATNKC